MRITFHLKEGNPNDEEVIAWLKELESANADENSRYRSRSVSLNIADALYKHIRRANKNKSEQERIRNNSNQDRQKIKTQTKQKQKEHALQPIPAINENQLVKEVELDVKVEESADFEPSKKLSSIFKKISFDD